MYAWSFFSSSKSTSYLNNSEFVSSLKLSTRKIGEPISTRITASTLNAMAYGVSPVAIRLVVQYAQTTFGSSSIQAPFRSSSFFLRLSFIVLFTASTWPLLYG